MFVNKNIIDNSVFEKIKDTGNLEKIQVYIPFYDNLFDEQNENISLKDLNILEKITKFEDNKIYINDSDCFFVKYSPLLDPVKYLCGKYENINIFDLPQKSVNIPGNKIANPIDKMADINNCSYVDNFFVYLSSKLLNEHKICHGLEY